jgi:hypothetical protein
MPTLLFEAPSGPPGTRIGALGGLFNGAHVPLDFDVRNFSWIEVCPEGYGIRFRKTSGSPSTTRAELAYYGKPYWPNTGPAYMRGAIVRLHNFGTSGWRCRGQEHEGNDSPAVAITDEGGVWGAELRGGPTSFIGTEEGDGDFTRIRSSVPVRYGEWTAVRYAAKTNPAGGDSFFVMEVAPVTVDENGVGKLAGPWQLVGEMDGKMFGYADGTPGRFWKAMGGLYGNPTGAAYSDLLIECHGAASAAELDAAMGWLPEDVPPPPPSDDCAAVRAQLAVVTAERDALVAELEANDEENTNLILRLTEIKALATLQ